MHLYEISIVLLLLSVRTVTYALKCFTCASADYEPLFERFAALRHSLSTPRFGELCDSVGQLQAFAPVANCPSTCISIMEPQYFGGVQSLSTPYTYIRGCTGTIFGAIRDHPPEVDFLHSETICLELRLSQIWPSIQTDEIVQVCSCATDGCNTNTASVNSSSAALLRPTSTFLIFLLSLLNAVQNNFLMQI